MRVDPAFSVSYAGTINPGGVFTQDHLIYVQSVVPPLLASYEPMRKVDTTTAVVNTSVPNAAGVFPINTGAQQTFRVNGGAIIEGTSGSNGVCIGMNAVETSGNGAVVIGGGASDLGIASISVIIGVNATVQGVAPLGAVAIGAGTISGQTSVAVGANAQVQAGSGAVVIGTSAVSSGVVNGAIAIGAAANLSTLGIAIGRSAVDMGTGVAQIGASGTPITTLNVGAGDTIATPAAKTVRFTNATGADNAAGNVTIQAPLSTGAAAGAAVVIAVGVPIGSSSTLQMATTNVIMDSTATIMRHLFGGTGALAMDALSQISANAGQVRTLRFASAGSGRWDLFANSTAESGGNAGSPFVIRALTDAGATIDDALTITRVAGGPITLNRNLTFQAAGTRVAFATTGRYVEAISTITYSASMTPALDLGNQQVITATNNTAFTINAPTGAGTGNRWNLMIRNTSGAGLGAATFNAVFKLGAAWTQPATGFSRSIQFVFDGTNHVEIGRTAADVAN